METHTLARYICELSLQEYSFVSRKPSELAAAALYMTLRMAAIGDWVRCSTSHSAVLHTVVVTVVAVEIRSNDAVPSVRTERGMQCTC